MRQATATTPRDRRGRRRPSTCRCRQGDHVDPARFSTGLVAELYGALRGHVSDDPEPWLTFIAQVGDPALELGCGDGDPLLALRQRGLDVEGVDSSPDMLARCRAAAAAQGLAVTLRRQAMEDLHLDRRYRSIFLAAWTFNRLPDDDTAQTALRAIHRHLTHDGQALIPLCVPAPTLPAEFGVPREHRAVDGTVLRITATAERIDERERTGTTRTAPGTSGSGSVTADPGGRWSWSPHSGQVAA